MNPMRHAILAVVIGAALAACATAGVYDDVTAWWHLDWADSGAITTSAQASNEIRDQRRWGDNVGYKATGVNGTPEWTNVGVPELGPAGGRTLGGRALVLDDSVGSEGFEVNNLSVTNDATLLTRIKWDGSIAHGGAATVYSNGFGWSADKGWMLRIVGTGQPQFYHGKGRTITASGLTLTPDTWYDLAVVLDENDANDTITFYRGSAGGVVEIAENIVDSFNGEVNSTTTRVGYEGGNYKYFGGQLENIALWDRALSANEVLEALTAPQAIWEVGIDNGTSDDMAGEWLTDADYYLGDPWGQMRRAVTASADEIRVHFYLTAEQAEHSFLFSFEPFYSRTFDISLNDVLIGSYTSTANSVFELELPWTLHLMGETDNVLELRYTEGSQWMSYDWQKLEMLDDQAPEPATLSLLGFGALALVRRRRR